MIPSNFVILGIIWGFTIDFVTLPFILLPNRKNLFVRFFTPVIRSRMLGIFLTAVGIWHISYISSWSSSWEILFSLMGYILVLKGLVLIATPKVVTFGERILLHPAIRVASAIVFLLGSYLILSSCLVFFSH